MRREHMPRRIFSDKGREQTHQTAPAGVHWLEANIPSQAFKATQPISDAQGGELHQSVFTRRVTVAGFRLVFEPSIRKVPTRALGFRSSLSLSGRRTLAVVKTSVSSEARTGLPLTLHLA